MKRILTAACAASILSLGSASAALSLEPVWSLAPGDRSYLTTDNNQRGIAYNPASGNLLLVNRAGAISINKLRASDGADQGTMSVTPAPVGGTFTLNLIRVAGDGAIYAANLVAPNATTAGILKVYKWADESASPTVVYEGNPSSVLGVRFGDTMDLRGSGANTQILFGSRNHNTFTVLTPTDGTATAFNAQYVTSDAPAGAFGLGVSFGPGDTVFGDSSGATHPTRQVSLTTGTLMNTLTTPATANSSLNNIDYSPEFNVLAGIVHNATGTRDQVIIYDTGSNAILDAENFPVDNANGNGVGSLDWGNGMLFAIDANNGVMAMSVVPEPSTTAIFAGLAVVGAFLRKRLSK